MPNQKVVRNEVVMDYLTIKVGISHTFSHTKASLQISPDHMRDSPTLKHHLYEGQVPSLMRMN